MSDLMKSFFSLLTKEQQASALAYRGEESHGDPSFKRGNISDYVSDRVFDGSRCLSADRAAKLRAGYFRGSENALKAARF